MENKDLFEPLLHAILTLNEDQVNIAELTKTLKSSEKEQDIHLANFRSLSVAFFTPQMLADVCRKINFVLKEKAPDVKKLLKLFRSSDTVDMDVVLMLLEKIDRIQQIENCKNDSSAKMAKTVEEMMKEILYTASNPSNEDENRDS